MFNALDEFTNVSVVAIVSLEVHVDISADGSAVLLELPSTTVAVVVAAAAAAATVVTFTFCDVRFSTSV